MTATRAVRKFRSGLDIYKSDDWAGEPPFRERPHFVNEVSVVQILRPSAGTRRSGERFVLTAGAVKGSGISGYSSIEGFSTSTRHERAGKSLGISPENPNFIVRVAELVRLHGFLALVTPARFDSLVGYPSPADWQEQTIDNLDALSGLTPLVMRRGRICEMPYREFDDESISLIREDIGIGTFDDNRYHGVDRYFRFNDTARAYATIYGGNITIETLDEFQACCAAIGRRPQ